MIDRPQTGQVVSRSCVRRQRLDGTCKLRVAARGFAQTVSPNADFYGGTLNLATLRGHLTSAAIHGNPVAVGDCQSAFHQSPLPNDSKPLHA